MKDNVSFKSFVELSELSSRAELFLQGSLERAAEELSHALHGEVIQKAVLMNMGQKKPAKKLQFIHLARWRRSAKCLDSHSSRTSSGKGSSCMSSCFFFQQMWEGEAVLEVPCLPLSCRWEVLLGGTRVYGIPAKWRTRHWRFFLGTLFYFTTCVMGTS